MCLLSLFRPVASDLKVVCLGFLLCRAKPPLVDRGFRPTLLYFTFSDLDLLYCELGVDSRVLWQEDSDPPFTSEDTGSGAKTIYKCLYREKSEHFKTLFYILSTLGSFSCVKTKNCQVTDEY